MKILYVRGDEYSAMYVQDKFGINEAVKLALENHGEYTIDTDEGYAEVSILEFGIVDSSFVYFVSNSLMDYELSKGTDFFVIED